MELEIINKLYLELSQVATAKTKREIELEDTLVKIGALILEIDDGEIIDSKSKENLMNAKLVLTGTNLRVNYT